MIGNNSMKGLKRTPEPSIRKSGSFHNLSKHSSSSDVHQRSSGSKAGTLARSPRASLELKENERDHHCLKQGKVRSPSMASSKNFMAPTISASSKVVAASPRRRILGERNEAVPVYDSPKSETRTVDLEMKKSSEVVVPRFPISPACDSLPPYDPMTNYLSPRPRFLHYQPNRRVEQCHLKKDKAFLDDYGEAEMSSSDSFSSDCFTNGTEEEQFSDLQKSSQEEVEVEVEVEEEEEEEVQGETEPQNVHIRTTRSTSRSKLVPFLLVLVMACLCCIPLSDSPLVSPSSVLKEGSSAKLEIREYLTDLAAFAKMNLEGMSDRFNHWSVKTMSYLSTMPWLRKDGDFGVFHLGNSSTTASDEEATVNFSFSETKPNLEHWKLELETEQIFMDDVEELEEEVEELEDGVFLGPEPEMRMQTDIMKDVEETHGVNESEMEIEVLHDVLENDHEALTVEEVSKEDSSAAESEVERKTEESPLGIDPVSDELGMIENPEDADKINSIVEILPAGFDGKHSITHAPKLKEIHGAGICVTVIAVIGSIVLYMKRRKDYACRNSGCDEKYGNDEVEMGGYSGSSSDGSISLDNKASFDRQRARRTKHGDSLGLERSLRRDSTASSSISYGSFTTYERLSAKKGARDEGAVTPVRRSSRIRNQVVSP